MTSLYRNRVLVPAAESSRLPAVRAASPDADDTDNAPGLAGQFRQFADYLAAALIERLAPMLRALFRETFPVPALATAGPGTVGAVAEASTLPPGYLSVEDAARWCGGVSPSTWRDWNARGIIPAPARIGGRIPWRMDDLANWSAWGHPGRAAFEERCAVAGGDHGPRDGRAVSTRSRTCAR